MTHRSTEIRPVRIGNRHIGPDRPVYIVAEMSANHRQDYDEAVRLIHAAKAAGADAVKLQTYTPDTMTVDCDDGPFRHGQRSLWEGQSLYRLYQKAYMPWEWQPRLQAVARGLGIDFFSSAYDPSSVDFLCSMQVPAIKIASFELVDLPLIRYAANTGIPLIMSTGMATRPEIETAVAAARSANCEDLILLKCTSAYPSTVEETNLRAIPAMIRTFGLPCGLSDHSLENLPAMLAVAMGACLLEKHFTLSRANNSADAGFSLEPSEFKSMVATVRRTEAMLGRAFPGPVPSEKESLSFRRSLYAVKDIPAGEVITAAHIRSIRPAGGLKPDDAERILGMKAKKTINRGQPITWDAIETA